MGNANLYINIFYLFKKVWNWAERWYLISSDNWLGSWIIEFRMDKETKPYHILSKNENGSKRLYPMAVFVGSLIKGR